MEKDLKKIQYSYFTRLIDDLAITFIEKKIDNNVFEEAKRLYLHNHSDDKDYNDEYIYMSIIPILLNNYPFFRDRFDKLEWAIPFYKFSENSRINGHSAQDYSPNSKEPGIHGDDYDEIYSYEDNPQYQEYLERKYGNTPYEPDGLDIIHYNLYDDVITFSGEQNTPLTEIVKEKNKIDKIKYKEAVKTLNDRLLNATGAPDIKEIIQYVRNFIAHHQYRFLTSSIELYGKKEEGSSTSFKFDLSPADMIMILANYLNMIYDRLKEMQKNKNGLKHVMVLATNSVVEIMDCDIEGSINRDYKTLYIELEKEFNELGLLKDYHKMLEENDLSIDSDNVEKLITGSKELISKNSYKIINRYKLQTIISSLKYIQILVNNNPTMKNLDYDDYDKVSLLLDEIATNFRDKADFRLRFNDEMYIAGINNLLNLIFVQCDCEDLDLSVIDLDDLVLNQEYTDIKNALFSSEIKTLEKKVTDELEARKKRTQKGIDIGKIDAKKGEILLATIDSKINHVNEVIKKKQDEWRKSITFTTSSKFNHIRNSFSHGYHVIETPNNGSELNDVRVIVKDFEPGTDKLTFSGTINLVDLLKQVLKPKLIEQLFDIKIKKEKERGI